MLSPRPKQTLLLFIVLGLGALGAGLWWTNRGAKNRRSLADLPKIVVAPPPEPPPQPEQVPPRDAIPSDEPPEETLVGTSVIWPLEVQLTLVARAAFETADGGLPPGTGANAGLQGHLWGPDDEGIRGTVTFAAGSNVGRVLTCDAEGAFGASDLYPGLNIVSIKTPMVYSAEREIRLRSRQEELLNIGFGRPSVVFGRVLDTQGEGTPIVGAEVMLDGHTASTNEEGVFYFPQVASGMALATVYKPGFARYREIVPISAGRTIEKDQLVFRLSPSASLEVVLEGAAGDVRSPAKVYLFPIGPQRVNSARGQQTFPWHLVSPIELYPGNSKVIEGLPDGHLLVSVFRPGAVAERPFVKVRIYEGRTTQQVVKLVPGPALRGRVVRDGHAVSGARVRLEAPNRQSASELVLHKDPEFNQELVFPHLPSGLQEVATDADGRFQVTLFPEVSNGYYLTAETLDGLWRAGRSVRSDETAEIEVELEAASRGDAYLRVGISPRFQGLPVTVRVMGAPRDPFELDPRDEQLTIDSLEEGTWHLDVAWHGENLLENVLVRVGEDVEQNLFVKLPPGAVDGQTEEERRRAGR
jgi:hypothetical protein